MSSIYATFLTSSGHQTRSSKLKFHSYPDKFPSQDTVTTFKQNLKNAIVGELNKGDDIYDEIDLSTDNAPEGILDQVLEDSGISFRNFSVHKLFPIKTSTSISKYSTRRITISMSARTTF